MREFFRGWRRKAGCVTLVMALAVMAVHLRSHHYRDWIQFHLPRGQVLGINSRPNCVEFEYRCTTQTKGIPPKDPAINWSDYKLDKVHTGWEWHHPKWSKSNWELGGDGIGRAYEISGWSVEATFSYTALTIPLTFLSAYLILWKPRTRMKRDA